MHMVEVPEISGASNSESLSRNSSRILLQCNYLNTGRKIWDLGKELGVTFEGDEEAIIQKFVEMEKRDRAGFSSVGEGHVS